MLAPCKCYKRHCKFYLGTKEPDDTEMTEVNYCEAFGKGIPDDIVYGNNMHLKVEKSQGNDIVFEKGIFEWEDVPLIPVGIAPLGDQKSLDFSQYEINNFVYNVLKCIKIMKKDSIVKEMSKDDWIQAWRDNPHWDKTESSPLVNKLLMHYGKDGELYVLEIGCGNGIDSVAFGKKGAKVIGIDISPDAISIANENNILKNVKFRIGDAENLDFVDSQFDLVYSMAVLHSSDLKKSIGEVSRVLKDNGEALLFLYQKTLRDSGEKEIDFKYSEIESLFKINDLNVQEKYKGNSPDEDEKGAHTHYWVVYILRK